MRAHSSHIVSVEQMKDGIALIVKDEIKIKLPEFDREASRSGPTTTATSAAPTRDNSPLTPCGKSPRPRPQLTQRTSPNEYRIVNVRTAHRHRSNCRGRRGRATKPTELAPGSIYSVIGTDGQYHLIDLDKDKYLKQPRAQGWWVHTVFDAESFTKVYEKHSLPETDVWADVEKFTVLAVFNADAGTAGKARLPDGLTTAAVSAVRKTPAWLAWERLDGKLGPQVTFAEHLEDRVIDIAEADRRGDAGVGSNL
ncbi:MAG: DUF2303 family protein [Nocardioidaceae bacterium]